MGLLVVRYVERENRYHATILDGRYICLIRHENFHDLFFIPSSFFCYGMVFLDVFYNEDFAFFSTIAIIA